ncbi:MAG TPA: hypothetical protein PLX87_05765 [Bacteroidales bacterium]|nr:hypothetical protein [Bacteroidales bacterium]
MEKDWHYEACEAKGLSQQYCLRPDTLSVGASCIAWADRIMTIPKKICGCPRLLTQSGKLFFVTLTPSSSPLSKLRFARGSVLWASKESKCNYP